jgi:DNA-binding transcriptional LysR family regulator
VRSISSSAGASDVADAERQVCGEDAAPRGSLVIAAPLTFGRLHVLPVVLRLLREHRALSIWLTMSDRNVHLVEEGIDVAVRIGEPADSALITLRVGEVRRMLVASPDYRLCGEHPDRRRRSPATT